MFEKLKLTDEQKAATRLWLAALRSGEYKQTKQRLRNNDGYCCLGVACDVALKNNLLPGLSWGAAPNEWGYAFRNSMAMGSLDSSTGNFPDGVGELFGLPTRSIIAATYVIDPKTEDFLDLYMMNDAWEKDFYQIAAAIEAYVEL